MQNYIRELNRPNQRDLTHRSDKPGGMVRLNGRDENDFSDQLCLDRKEELRRPSADLHRHHHAKWPK